MEKKMSDIHLLIGGAGFIGHTLIGKLSKENYRIICVDDNTSGNFENSVVTFGHQSNVEFFLGDINKKETLNWIKDKCKNQDVIIWHLAANSDIKSGSGDPNLDANKTFMTSVTVCNLVDALSIKSINFASTSAVYGELQDDKIFTENSLCKPISYYGIAKQSSEEFLEIKARSNGVPLLIFRFANIVGQPATHGVLYDFINRIKLTPNILKVLGNGQQRKSYLHVENLVAMMVALWSEGNEGIFNLGPGDEGISVREIANLLAIHLKNPIAINYGTNARGWDGDAVKVLMSSDKLDSACSVPKKSSSEAIHQAIHDISHQLSLDIICPDSEKQIG